MAHTNGYCGGRWPGPWRRRRILVGEVQIDVNDGQVTVRVSLYDGVITNEVHTTSNEPVARTPNGRPSVAPGQFEHGGEFEEATQSYEVTTAIDGPIYVITHVEACGEFPTFTPKTSI